AGPAAEDPAQYRRAGPSAVPGPGSVEHRSPLSRALDEGARRAPQPVEVAEAPGAGALAPAAGAAGAGASGAATRRAQPSAAAAPVRVHPAHRSPADPPRSARQPLPADRLGDYRPGTCLAAACPMG